MVRRLLIACIMFAILPAAHAHAQNLQQALDALGYSVNVTEDVIPGELFFQRMSSDASIIFQESSHQGIEAMGWYNADGGPNWIVGGSQTGFPMIAQMPSLSGPFGFVMHTNYTGEGYLEGIWYSQSVLNSDLADHVRVFPTKIAGVQVPYSYILAWEDLAGLGDADYQDMIVRVTGVEAITPEPTADQLLNLVQWKVEDGGNGHWYAVLSSPLFWSQARDYVHTLVQAGVSGHLATITSIEENTFIFQSVTAGLHNPSILDQYFMGGLYEGGSWSWITGEPFLFTNWSPGEPNNDPAVNESRVSMWGPYVEGSRIPGMWNNVAPNTYTFWSLVEWDVPSQAAFSLSGNIGDVNGAAMTGIAVNVYDATGLLLGTAISAADGSYALQVPGESEVLVELQVPLGFYPATASPIHLPGSGIWTVPFSLASNASDKVTDYWWWKGQLENIKSGRPPQFGSLTRETINAYGKAIYDHFYEQPGGYVIRINGLTYAECPARAMTFDDIYATFFSPLKNTDAGKTKAHLLTVLLNVASGRLGQLSVVSEDGANVSQAITYYAGKHASGWNDWSYWYNIMKIHCPSFGVIPAGIIPLSTPVILYKENGNSESLPDSPLLAQNYPNPFNPSTEISFSLPERQQVSLEVFNTTGQKISVLVDEQLDAGSHRFTFQAKSLASGVYFYRLTVAGDAICRKMMLLK